VHWTDKNAKCFGMLLDGRAQATGIRRLGSDATLLLVFNAHHDVVEFTLPAVPDGKHWVGLIDTNQPERTERPVFDFGDVYEVTGRSLLLFALVNGDKQLWRLHDPAETLADIDAWITRDVPDAAQAAPASGTEADRTPAPQSRRSPGSAK
jgi:isoamylase